MVGAIVSVVALEGRKKVAMTSWLDAMRGVEPQTGVTVWYGNVLITNAKLGSLSQILCAHGTFHR